MPKLFNFCYKTSVFILIFFLSLKFIPVLFKPILHSDDSFTVGLDVEKIKHIYLYIPLFIATIPKTILSIDR